MSVVPLRGRPRSCKFKLWEFLFHIQHSHIEFLEKRICGFFKTIGLSIGRNPGKCLLISLVISLLSIGCVNIKFAQNLQDGFVAKNSMARIEQAVKNDFDGEQSSKVQRFVLMIRRIDNGNILDRKYYKQLAHISEYLSTNLTVSIDGSNYTHSQISGKYNNTNVLLWVFVKCLDGVYANEDVFLDHPQSRISQFSALIAPHVFGISKKDPPELDIQGQIHVPYNSNDSFPENSNRTGLREAKMISMYFMAPIPDDNITNIVTEWESAVYTFAYKNRSLFKEFRFDIMGDKILGKEMVRGGLSLFDFFVCGIVMMIVLVSCIVYLSSFAAGRVDCGFLLVIVGMISTPMIAIVSTFGFVHGILGIEMYPTIMVIPFLILAIGVDDAFLMNGAFTIMQEKYRSMENGKGDTVAAIIFSEVMESVGPSITITSLTNAIAFGIGMTSDSPAVQVFCLTAMIAILFDYVLEIILFGSLLVNSGHCFKLRSGSEEHQRGFKNRKKKVIRSYSSLLMNNVTRVVVMTFTFVFFLFSLYQAVTIKIRVDSEKIIPQDSHLLEADRLFRIYYWKEYEPLQIFVSNPPKNLTSQSLKDLKSMIEDFENMPKSLGRQSTMVWLKDYEKTYSILYNFYAMMGGDFSLSYDELEHFLTETPAKHVWNQTIKWRKEGDQVKVDQFMFVTGIHNGSTWEERALNMIHWREVAKKWQKFNVSVYSENSAVFEGIHGLPSQTILSTVLTLCSMIVVCIVFIPSFVGVMFAAFAILDISVCVVGYLHWAGFNLDPVTQSAILMSIGFSVDFTAHISFHFQSAWSKAPRGSTAQDILEHTFDSVGVAMLESAVSTMVCFVPPAWHNDYTPRVFVATVFFLVAYGAFFGLFILPTILAMLPKGVFVIENPLDNLSDHPTRTPGNLEANSLLNIDTSSDKETTVSLITNSS